jgi:hypothetical protein
MYKMNAHLVAVNCGLSIVGCKHIRSQHIARNISTTFDTIIIVKKNFVKNILYLKTIRWGTRVVPEVEGNFRGEPIDGIHVGIVLRQVLPHTNLKTKRQFKGTVA